MSIRTDPSAAVAAAISSVFAGGEAARAPLTPTGPRVGADRGAPQTSIRVLYESADGRISVGIWGCTPGGWAIVNRPDSETIHLLAGRATITDADGTTHHLEPGSTIVLPRGWSGRWDIHEPVRKLYVTVAG